MKSTLVIPELVSQALRVLMSSILECNMERMADIIRFPKGIASFLWKIDNDVFGFYKENSKWFIDERGSSSSCSNEEYMDTCKRIWIKILQNIKELNFDEEMTNCFHEFQYKMFDAFMKGSSKDVEVFCVLFILLLKKISPLTFRRLELKHPAQVSEVLSNSELFNIRRSFEYSPDEKRKRDYMVTDKSIQELVNRISGLEGEKKMLEQEGVFREKEVIDLKEKESDFRKEKKELIDLLEDKENELNRMRMKIGYLEEDLKLKGDNREHKDQIDSFKRRIDELMAEIERLQKKNRDLEDKISGMLLSNRLVKDPISFNYEESEEMLVARLRNKDKEVKVLKDQIVMLESRLDSATEGYLREKEKIKKIGEEKRGCEERMVGLEVEIRGKCIDVDSLKKQIEMLENVIVRKEYDMKQLQFEYQTMIRNGTSVAGGASSSGLTIGKETQETIELVKVCKEVNHCYLKELECVYALLHDTFVGELTGTSINEIVKKRMEEKLK